MQNTTLIVILRNEVTKNLLFILQLNDSSLRSE